MSYYVWKSLALSTNLKIRENNLHCDSLFGEVWSELFNKRHALVPDIIVAKVVAFMLLPIATLLAMSSADQRRNAMALLRMLQSKFCLALWILDLR